MTFANGALNILNTFPDDKRLPTYSFASQLITDGPLAVPPNDIYSLDIGAFGNVIHVYVCLVEFERSLPINLRTFYCPPLFS